jgi:hypothetical protein
MSLIKIETYTVIANPTNETYKMRLNLETQKYFEMSFKSLSEMNNLVTILRNEDNCFLSEKTHDLVIGREPVGENDIW